MKKFFLDPSVFGFAPVCSVGILAEWLGLTPEAILARFKTGTFPREALHRVGDRALIVDLQLLLTALRSKNAKPQPVPETREPVTPEGASL